MEGNNKSKWLIILGSGLVIIVVLVVILLRPSTKKAPEEKKSVLPQDQTVKQAESSIQVGVSLLPDGKRVKLAIENIPSKYQEIEYEFSYDTEKGVPRGVLGTITVAGDSYEKEIVLGSCSTNTCTYDAGVKKVKVSLKFTGSSGASVFEKEFEL
jgi:hypothetical protein